MRIISSDVAILFEIAIGLIRLRASMDGLLYGFVGSGRIFSASCNLGLPVSNPGFVTRIAPLRSRRNSRRLSSLRSNDISPSASAARPSVFSDVSFPSKSAAVGSGRASLLSCEVPSSLAVSAFFVESPILTISDSPYDLKEPHPNGFNFDSTLPNSPSIRHPCTRTDSPVISTTQSDCP
nr:hypothetical 19K protein - potato virus M (strain Russian) [Potato virus M]